MRNCKKCIASWRQLPGAPHESVLELDGCESGARVKRFTMPVEFPALRSPAFMRRAGQLPAHDAMHFLQFLHQVVFGCATARRVH